VNGPTPLLEFFKRGEAPRDARMGAAQGVLAPRAHEQLAILILLLGDSDQEIRRTARDTLDRISPAAIAGYLGRPDVPAGVREFFAERGIVPSATPASDTDDPLIIVDSDEPAAEAPGGTEEQRRESLTQQVAKMGFSQRLKAAMKGSREIRAILIRDPNKMIATSVLSSPKVTENEVEAFARMANVGEDVLRIIGSNRAWTKNYSVVVGLTKNPKTPLGMSLNLMPRLNDRDLQMLSMDRNVPEPLRVAARKRLVEGTGKR
jgi:hypothetical protein